MLKGIPKILSPELLKVLAEMGVTDWLFLTEISQQNLWVKMRSLSAATDMAFRKF